MDLFKGHQPLVLLLAVFLALWTQDPARYSPAMTKAAEATYAGSELKPMVDQAAEYARAKAPVLSAVAPAGYALAVRKEVRLTSSKVTLVPGTVTTYNANKSAVSIGVTWSF